MKNLLRAMYMDINAMLYKFFKERSAFYSFANLAACLFLLTRGIIQLMCRALPLVLNYSLNPENIEISANILIGFIIIWLIYDLYIKGNYLRLLKNKRYNNDRTYIKGIVLMVGSFLILIGVGMFIFIYKRLH